MVGREGRFVVSIEEGIGALVDDELEKNKHTRGGDRRTPEGRVSAAFNGEVRIFPSAMGKPPLQCSGEILMTTVIKAAVLNWCEANGAGTTYSQKWMVLKLERMRMIRCKSNLWISIRSMHIIIKTYPQRCM